MSTNEENNALAELEPLDPTSEALAGLTQKQQRFIHLYLTGQYTVQKLAQLLEVHPNTLFNWLKRTDVKDIIADMQATTHDMVAVQLKNLTMAATDKLSKLINSPIDGVALQAVKDILDRSGHKAKQEIKVDKTVTTIEQKLGELINSTIVDAEFTVTEE